MKTFIELVREGKYTPGQIDDWVDAWHSSNTTASLHDSLGLTEEEYHRWVEEPNTLIPIIGQHGIVTEEDDLELRGLEVSHNILGSRQESSFQNACLTEENNVTVSIAAVPPKSYHTLSPKAFNKAMQRDLFRLVEAGWEFEIQRGPNEEGNAALQAEMIAAIES